MYYGESTVIERYCEDFLKILKKYKILKVKAGPGRMLDLPDVDCETHKRGNPVGTESVTNCTE